jgi:hypothetical protein
VWSDKCNDVSEKAASTITARESFTLIHPDNGNSRFLWNVDTLPDYTASYPRRKLSFKIFWFWTLSILPGPPPTQKKIWKWLFPSSCSRQATVMNPISTGPAVQLLSNPGPTLQRAPESVSYFTVTWRRTRTKHLHVAISKPDDGNTKTSTETSGLNLWSGVPYTSGKILKTDGCSVCF